MMILTFGLKMIFGMSADYKSGRRGRRPQRLLQAASSPTARWENKT